MSTNTPPSPNLEAIKAAETALLEQIDDAIDLLDSQLKGLSARKKSLEEQLCRLLEAPLPASDYPELLGSWIDRLAKQGEREVGEHLRKNLPREKKRYGDDSRPLSYVAAERLASGRNVVEECGIQVDSGTSIEQLLPLDAKGSLSLPCVAYLFGDQIKARLVGFLEASPVSYSGLPGLGVGPALAQRRDAVEKTRCELSEVTVELEARTTEVASLRHARRMRGG